MSTVVADVGGAAQGVISSKPSLPLPLPVMLGLAGAGIGLVVFIMRKSQAGAATGGNSASSTLLPNTNIMLGSLQQGVLDLKGQIGTSSAALGDQLTGSTTATQSLIGATGLATNALIGATTQQTQQLVADSSNALTTAINAGFSNQSASSDSMFSKIAALFTNQGQQIGALGTGITNLGQTVKDQNAAVIGAVGQVNQNVANGNSSLATAIAGIKPDLSGLEGKWFLQDLGGGQGGGMLRIMGGKAYNVSWANYVRTTGDSGINNRFSFWTPTAVYADLQKQSMGYLG